jgi:hypothetical protein
MYLILTSVNYYKKKIAEKHYIGFKNIILKKQVYFSEGLKL